MSSCGYTSNVKCLVQYMPNLPFLISDIFERKSARMWEIKNGRLGMYGKV